MKPCYDCGETKPLEDFARNRGNADGQQGQCKRCQNEASRRWRILNPEKARKTRPSPGHRESRRRWREKNQDKKLAQTSVYRAVRSGRLVRPDRCETCLTVGPVQAHHDDYAQRLDVRWLCQRCHQQLHAARSRLVKEPNG